MRNLAELQPWPTQRQAKAILQFICRRIEEDAAARTLCSQYSVGVTVEHPEWCWRITCVVTSFAGIHARFTESSNTGALRMIEPDDLPGWDAVHYSNDAVDAALPIAVRAEKGRKAWTFECVLEDMAISA